MDQEWRIVKRMARDIAPEPPQKEKSKTLASLATLARSVFSVAAIFILQLIAGPIAIMIIWDIFLIGFLKSLLPFLDLWYAMALWFAIILVWRGIIYPPSARGVSD